MTTRHDFKNAMADGDALIGVMVYWTELTGVRVARPLFRTGVRQCGLGAALADEPKPEAVLNRAVGVGNRSTRGDVATKTKCGYAKLKRKDDDATYSLLMRRDVGDRMGYREEATISIQRDATDPAPIVEVDPTAPADPARDRLVEVIVDEYTEQLRFANTEEVSQTLVRAVRDTCSGLTLRSGLYLVHPEHVTELTALQAFLASSCGATLEVWEQRSTARNAEVAQRNASALLRGEFTDLVAEVQAFAERHTDPDEVAQKSINARVRRFKELDGRVQLYADILGDHRDELLAAIADAKHRLLGAYLGSEDSDDEIAA